ncbi:MAG: UMP kinase [Corallococcus sp.]|nr:UMP kinase [Corallococcus sp.]
MVKYKRIILKVSGEALSKDSGGGISFDAALAVARQIKEITELGVQTGVVVGAGNLWRGRQADAMDRGIADYIGMMGTVMNALTVGEALKSEGVQCKVVSALAIEKAVEPCVLSNVEEYFNQGKVVVFAAGTGLPYVSTDTTAALRACEYHADAVICSKNVDGIYDSDPKVNPSAKKYDTLTYDDVLSKGLKALDLTATAMCKEFNVPIIIFGKDEPNALINVICGKKLGTIIK